MSILQFCVEHLSENQDKLQAVPERLPLRKGSSFLGPEFISNYFHFPAQQFPNNNVIQAVTEMII